MLKNCPRLEIAYLGEIFLTGLTKEEKYPIFLTKMKKLFFSFFILFFLNGKIYATVAAPDCKHNLSASNNLATPAIRATSETQVCKFCHIPHGNQANSSGLTYQTTGYAWYGTIYGSEYNNKQFRLPLNSHVLTAAINSARVSFSSGGVYNQYEPNEDSFVRISSWAYGPSSGFVLEENNLDDPDDDTMEIEWPSSGVSRMCFSCHDGTVRIGEIYNSTGGVQLITMNTDAGTGKINASGYMQSGATRRYDPPNVDYHSDFASLHSCEHAFYSFYMNENVITDASDYKQPGTPSRGLHDLSVMRGRGVLDRDDFVQCSACHDPHKGGTGTANGGPPNETLGAYSGGLRQFWRKPGEAASEVCLDCHSE